MPDDNTACEREKYWINELRTYIGFKDCNGYSATLDGDSKKYYNTNEIVDTYLKCNSVKETAKLLNCSVETVSKYCNDVGIETNKHSKKDVWKIYIPTMKVEIYSCLQDVVDNNNITMHDLNIILTQHYIYNNSIWLRDEDYSEELITQLINRYLFEHIKGNNFSKKDNNIDKNMLSQNEIKKSIKIVKYVNKYDYLSIYKDYMQTGNIIESLDKFNVPKSYRSRAKQILKKRYKILFQNNNIKIGQYSKSGELLHIFNTIREANSYMGKPIDSRNISSCLLGKTKTAYGFIWRYIKNNNII